MVQKNTVYLSCNSQKNLDNQAKKFIIERAELAIKNKGSFSLVLSGGSTPVNVYKLLANDICRVGHLSQVMHFEFSFRLFFIPDKAE